MTGLISMVRLTCKDPLIGSFFKHRKGRHMDIAAIIATAVYCIFEGIAVIFGLAIWGIAIFWMVLLVLALFGR